jgi:hypothetical protein
MRWPLAGLLVLVGCFLSGCGSSTTRPTTYPVQGKIAYKFGTAFPGGQIQFRANPDNGLTSVGQIAEDGSYKLETLANNTNFPGAPEGTYNVTIMPLMGPDQSGGRPITLPGTFKVKPQDDNTLNFTVDKPRGK